MEDNFQILAEIDTFQISVDSIDLSKPAKYLNWYCNWRVNSCPILNGIIGKEINDIYIRSETGNHFMTDNKTIIDTICFCLSGGNKLEISVFYDWMWIAYNC